MSVLSETPLQDLSFRVAGEYRGPIIRQSEAGWWTKVWVRDSERSVGLDDDGGKLGAGRTKDGLLAKELDEEEGAIVRSNEDGAGAGVESQTERNCGEKQGPENLASLVVPDDACLVLAGRDADARLGVCAGAND